MLMRRLIFVLMIISSINCANDSKLKSKIFFDLTKASDIFDDYIITFKKNYENYYEYVYRFNIFKQNLNYLNKLNEASNITVYGINQFTDYTHKEVTKKFMGLKVEDFSSVEGLSSVKYVPRGPTPKELDYRKDCVTAVKNQGQCGSCYAFSVIGNIEGVYAKKHRQLISLSEQQAMDCDNKSEGCIGGYMNDTITGLASEGGCMREEDYPYYAAKGECHTNASKIVVKVKRGEILEISNIEDLKNALANTGPLSVGIIACYEFHSYESGIFTEDCKGSCDHAVVLVGYSSENGVDYWIIKNSWGVNWGEEGYIRMQMREEICGLGTYVVTAIIE